MNTYFPGATEADAPGWETGFRQKWELDRAAYEQAQADRLNGAESHFGNGGAPPGEAIPQNTNVPVARGDVGKQKPQHVENITGASVVDWNHFDALGLTADLLPVVSNPKAEVSPRSSIGEVGKVPSLYDSGHMVVGIKGWTSKQATTSKIAQWSKQRDYGICLQTRNVRAFDGDIVDPALAGEIEQFIGQHLGRSLPARRRPNSPKFLLAFTLPGGLSKRVLKAAHGNIEFLASGQQFVAVGTHPSGVRYEWPGGLPDEFPALTLEEFEALWSALTARFAVEPSRETRQRAPRAAVLADATRNDPVAQYLVKNDWVHSTERDGKINITCPFADEHTAGESESGTSYFPAHTGGFAQGHFKCLHAHCEGRTDGEFLAKIGYATRADFTHVSGGTAHDDVAAAAVAATRGAFEQARREQQNAESERIGAGGDYAVPSAESLTLDQMLQRYVFVSDGSRVVDVFNPHYNLPFSDFAATFAASVELVPQPPTVLKDGKTKDRAPKEVPVTKLWLACEHRKTVVSLTFKAGAAPVINDPNGRLSVNSWRGFDRSATPGEHAGLHVAMLLDHIAFLFPDPIDRGRFLDWLAHIEQQPGVLPHTAWLHIARTFGLGRNWLAAVLVRIWAGSVAPSFDLPGSLRSGFNGPLAGKVLAITDEIHEGGKEHWEFSERLKSMVTEATRLINPKYGRQHIEFNSCRLLMFSNHLSAIPIRDGDRRWEVVCVDQAPRAADYYAKLYGALDDPQFIASVASFLGQRDIGIYNPGAWAVGTASKQAAVRANRTPMAENCERLVNHWPSDLITAAALYEVLTNGSPVVAGGSAQRRTLEEYRIEPLGRPVKVDGTATRISIVRNCDRWIDADADAIRLELRRAPSTSRIGGALDVLLDAEVAHLGRDDCRDSV